MTKRAKSATYEPTPAQQAIQECIQKHPISFIFGGAGTGKTHAAAMEGAYSVEECSVSRMILMRPAIEAEGEDLGYLPGSAEQKVEPYLYPVLDSLKDVWPHPEGKMKSGQLEYWPIAHLRGRTFRDAFALVDEAQNLTMSQMYLVLTRIGIQENNRLVLVGDWDQPDRERGANGRALCDMLRGRPNVGHIDLRASDVVRHPVVVEVINAYSEIMKQRAGGG